MIYSWDTMEVIVMDYVGRAVTEPSSIDNTEMQNILNELNTWCMNYRGFINQVFSEQVTMEEKVTKLFWVIKKVAESQLDVTDNYNELYQFVINYFDSHDFQTMVDNKLDEMAQDGTLESLINDKILGDIKNDINNVNTKVASLEDDMSDQKVLVGKLTNWSLSGKQIDWFGDSLMRGETEGGSVVSQPIPSIFASMTGATCVNHAESGATIANNEWATKVINQVNEADLTNSDYVIVQGGINDYFLNYPIGDDSLLGSFTAGLIEIFNTIDNKNHSAKIIMCSLFPNEALFEGSLGHDGENFLNFNNAIKRVCKERCVKCIDMTYNSINRNYFSTVCPTGTHFTQEGYNLLAKAILNLVFTAETSLPEKVGNNLIKGFFPTMNLEDISPIVNNGAYRHGNCILIHPGETVYSCFVANLLAGAYTLHFKMSVGGNGSATVNFGCETYEKLGVLNNIEGTGNVFNFRDYEITINPTTFKNRLLFSVDADSTAGYVVITDITLCPGEVACYGDEIYENKADLALTGFNAEYPLQFKQRDRFVSFNGPIQTKQVIPVRTGIVDMSNYSFAKGKYSPNSAVIFAAGLDGNVYPLLLDFNTYILENLKEIPANTNLGITAVIDIS